MSEATTIVRGYLSSDPRINTTKNGTPVGNVVVPHTPRKYDRDSREWVDAGETTWFEATCWGASADILQSLAKGDEVRVEGRPVVEMYETRDGRQGAKIRLESATVALISRKRDREERQGGAQRPSAPESGQWVTRDIPGAQAGAQQGGGGFDEPPF